MRREEEQVQKSLVKTFYLTVNLDDYLIYSNRNENSQGKQKGVYLGRIYKEMGRFAGVPDLTIIGKNLLTYVEVKSPSSYKKKNNDLSDSQLHFIEKYIIPFNIPFKVVCNDIMFLDFLKELKIIK